MGGRLFLLVEVQCHCRWDISWMLVGCYIFVRSLATDLFFFVRKFPMEKSMEKRHQHSLEDCDDHLQHPTDFEFSGLSRWVFLSLHFFAWPLSITWQNNGGGGIKNVGLCVLVICDMYVIYVKCTIYICLITYNIATYFFSVFVPKRTSGSSPRLHWGSGLCQVCTGRSPPGRLQSTCIDMQQNKQSQLTTVHEILQPWYIYM